MVEQWPDNRPLPAKRLNSPRQVNEAFNVINLSNRQIFLNFDHPNKLFKNSFLSARSLFYTGPSSKHSRHKNNDYSGIDVKYHKKQLLLPGLHTEKNM